MKPMRHSKPTVTLRTANNIDFDVVAKIWHESASLPGVGPPIMPTLCSLRARVDLELSRGWEVTVACVHNDIVGFAAFKPDHKILDQLFVKPSFHGGGAGKMLLRHAMSRMHDGFTLHTASANRLARRFYEIAGLASVREGSHPTTGHPVTFYEWAPVL